MYVISLISGALFAAGLALGGMVQPENIKGFLDIFGQWNPALAFVLFSAVGTYMLASRIILRKRNTPITGGKFLLITDNTIDWKLVVGAGLFGIGWALAGYCPGPVFASIVNGGIGLVAFIGTMLFGRYLISHVLLKK